MRKISTTLFFLLSILIFTTPVYAGSKKSGKAPVSAKPTHLTCNLRTGLVVTDSEIRLGWQPATEQSAYSLTIEDAISGRNITDTKKQKSQQSQFIDITIPDGFYRWKVTTYAADGTKSPASDYQYVLKQTPSAAFATAKWVGAITKADAHTPEGRTFTGAELKARKAEWDAADPLSRRSIYVGKTIRLAQKKQPKSAILNVCGLGFYELKVNNTKLGDSEFAPTWSDYDKSVYYNTYALSATDLTALGISDNSECRLEALLGNGFYNEQGGRYHKLRISFGPPTLKLHLKVFYSDGTSDSFVTDESWQWSPSELTFNSIYGGEDYDARLHREWKSIVVQEGPKGLLRPQVAPAVKIMQRYEPQSVKLLSTEERKGAEQIAKHELPEGTFVLDMGQNLAGVPEIRVKGKTGQSITLYVSETLTPEGACNQRQTGRQHYYQYTLKGDGIESYRPRFSYYGFRYIQVEGAQLGDSLCHTLKANPCEKSDLPVLESIASCFVHNSAATVSTFECSNERVNKTHELIDKAVRSNMQSVFTDCPHREKLGWLEQDWLNGPGLFFNYDLTGFAAQTMQNIADAQHADGGIPTTAPEYVYFRGPGMDVFAESPEWGGTFIMMPWMYLKHYGDDSLLRRYYPQMRHYIDYLHSLAPTGILTQGLGDWYDYGDFRAGFAHNTSVPLVATAHHYRWTALMSQIAQYLGKAEEAQELMQRALDIKAAWQKAYYPTPQNINQIAADDNMLRSQTGMAIGLNLGLIPEADRTMVLDSLIADIHCHGDRLTTGDIGNRYLFEVLCEEGLQELLYTMLNHDDVPGYGYQMKKGMTTLTEQWNPDMGSSMNHFMMGHIDGFHFSALCGMEIDGPRVSIKLRPVADISHASASTQTPFGTVSVAWQRDLSTRKITSKIDIPVGMTCDFVHENGTTSHLLSGHYEVDF